MAANRTPTICSGLSIARGLSKELSGGSSRTIFFVLDRDGLGDSAWARGKQAQNDFFADKPPLVLKVSYFK